MYEPSILLIGDDAAALNARRDLLAHRGHEVEVAVGRTRGIVACNSRSFDVIVVLNSDQAEAEALACDLAIVAPATEIVNLTQWYARGLTPENEPGLLLSFVSGAVQPITTRRAASPRRVSARRRSG